MTDKINFQGTEKHDYEIFRDRHVCPDRKPHDRVEYSVSVSENWAGIGSNLYVKCNRCGTMQDITDYSEW